MLNALMISEFLPTSIVVSYTFRMIMSKESSAECSRTPPEKTITDENEDILLLLKAGIHRDDFCVAYAYLKSHELQQITLDRCLQCVFETDQENYSTIRSSVMVAVAGQFTYFNESRRYAPRWPLWSAETIQLLLQLGAKWSHDVVMEDLITPYHIICRSTDDNSELLDLMIESTGRRFLNTKDSIECTPLMYAVRLGNIKCVRSLIAHGADVNLGNKKLKDESFIAAGADLYMEMRLVNPLIESIMLLHPDLLLVLRHSSGNMIGIFDLLLESGVNIDTPGCDNRTPLMYAAAVGSTYCFSKLIEKGARHDRADDCDRNVMYWAVVGGNISTIRYLLHKSVSVEYLEEVPHESFCHLCGIYTLFSDDMLETDPCMKAVWMDKVDVVQLMNEHGNHIFQSFAYLRCAVMGCSEEVLKYLLSKYKYPLNHEYVVGDDEHGNFYTTLLVDACTRSVKLVRLLLEHGADPNQNNGIHGYPNVIATAIMEGQVETVACLIRSGSNVNSKVWHDNMQASPFELSILNGNIDVAEMLLCYGCSCGVFSLETNHTFKDNVKPDLVTLMKNWNVHKNNVIPLQLRCRMVILEHMSPVTEEKITNLPLPSVLRTYLTIQELDDRYKKENSG